MQPKDLGDVPTHTSGVAEVQLGDEAEKGDKQEKDGKKEEEKPETVGLFELYKFSDTTDKLVLALGVVMAITCGSLFWLCSYYFQLSSCYSPGPSGWSG